MTTTMRVTWGERLRIAVDRWRRANGCDFKTLAAACATVEDATSNTYKKLLWELDAPGGKAARRAHVLVLAIGGDPSDHDVVLRSRPATWPSDDEIRGLLDRSIWPDDEEKYAPGDSNPEPSVSSSLQKAA